MSYPQSSLNIDPSKFSSLKDVQPIQPKDTFLTSVSKWIRTNIQKPLDLKSPGRYDEHDREAKNVFISPNELGDGVSVSVGRPIAQSSYHDVAVSHGISVGSMMRPPEYTLGYTFSSIRGLMYAQVTSNQVFIANLKQKYLKRRLGLEFLYVNANDTLQFKTEYNGNDNVTNAEWHHDNGKFVLGYMQSVLKNLDLGTSAYYKTSDRKSGVSTAARYHEGDLVLTGEYVIRGASENNDHIFRGTYYERIDNSTVMVAEMTYDFTENDSKFQYGFQQNYLNGRYRVTADNAFQIRGVFEHKVSPIGNVQVTVDADPTKSEFKFGFNIQFG